MKNQEKESPLGLDVGTSRICLARRGDGPTEYETQLNAFVSVPKSPITERVLGKEKIPHTVRDSDILVHGNEAGRFAGMLGIETRRTMTRGMLNPEEPDSVAVLKDMIQAATRRYGEQSERRVCFTVPAARASGATPSAAAPIRRPRREVRISRHSSTSFPSLAAVVPAAAG